MRELYCKECGRFLGEEAPPFWDRHSKVRWLVCPDCQSQPKPFLKRLMRRLAARFRKHRKQEIVL